VHLWEVGGGEQLSSLLEVTNHMGSVHPPRPLHLPVFPHSRTAVYCYCNARTGLHEGGVVGQDSGCDRSGPQQAAQRSRGSALLGSTGVCVCVCVCVCLYRHDYIHIRVYIYSLACLYECVGRHVYM
jgi:hypothetical protein